MVKAIIFDCFGVLVTEEWLNLKTKLFGHNPELFGQATSLNQQADAGLISHDDFVIAVAELANLPPAEVNRAINNNAPNEPLFEYIGELKKNYKIGMLSNAAANWLGELFTPEQVELFDAVNLSYDSGIPKPDKRAYEIIAERLRVEIDECVLVDDQERHCAGAREAGMQAILYQDFPRLKADLEALLANPKG